MYKCDSCGNIFEKPILIADCNEYGDIYGHMECCPICEDEENFKKVSFCLICGSWESYLHSNIICANCYKKI